jgi:23S rRNA pseudouridine1911/1915/1917 synthase
LKKSEQIISSEVVDPEIDGALDADTEVELRAWTIAQAQHGWRLDRALAASVPEFSRSYLQQLIEAGAVSRGTVALTKAAMHVRAGDQGLIELRPTPQSQAFKPQSMELTVVYEDEHLLVINKAAGMVVHPAPGHWSGTLLNGLLARDAQALNLPRAGIVHRLDKDTSGLMVVARTRACMDALVNLIARREVRRIYLALAHHPWQGTRRKDVDAAIGRDPRNRLRMAVVDPLSNPGKAAKTSFELLENAADTCLLQCTLHTGRTHQIRVHLASIGHPIVADSLYGGAPAVGLQRQALHAIRLAFNHPISGTELDFQAPLPSDFRQALGLLGLGYNAP